MEKGDCATGIFGILLHVENVGRYFIIFKFFGFCLFMQFLFFVDLEKENDSKDWLTKHLLGPLLSGQQILNSVDGGVKSLIRESIPNSAMNLFMTSGLDSRGSQLSSSFYISYYNYQ